MPHRRERYDEKLVQILESACGIFAEKGYHHASVRDVASATGVSPASLYYYFQSKEELLFLILHHALRDLLHQVDQAVPGALDPEEKVRAIVRTHLAFFRSHPAEIRLMAREWDSLTGDFRKRILRRQRTYAAVVIRTLRELRPDASRLELRAATMGLLGMLNWMYQWYHQGGNLSVEGLGEEFTRIFLRGFLPQDGKGTGRIASTSDSNQHATVSANPNPPSLLSGPGF